MQGHGGEMLNRGSCSVTHDSGEEVENRAKTISKSGRQSVEWWGDFSQIGKVELWIRNKKTSTRLGQ